MPRPPAYTKKENEIIRACFELGDADREIAGRLALAGFSRTERSVREHRKAVLGLSHLLDEPARPPAEPECPYGQPGDLAFQTALRAAIANKLEQKPRVTRKHGTDQPRTLCPAVPVGPSNINQW